jgi:hypothetical protein
VFLFKSWPGWCCEAKKGLEMEYSFWFCLLLLICIYIVCFVTNCIEMYFLFIYCYYDIIFSLCVNLWFNFFYKLTLTLFSKHYFVIMQVEKKWFTTVRKVYCSFEIFKNNCCLLYLFIVY